MTLPFLGYGGLGLRIPHYQQIIETRPSLDFLEFITEDYFNFKSHAYHCLEKIRAIYPMVMHGISLSIGSTDPLNMDYLNKVKQLAEQIQPSWISDHLCWTGVEGINLHDLLPIPYTQESLDHLVTRILKVQDYLNRPLILENPSTYLSFKHNEFPEWEFFSYLVKKTDCRILLDINNVYVSSFNCQFDPFDYLDGIPKESVQQIHLAGHKNFGTHIIDTHNETINEEIWRLYEYTLERLGPISTLIERDDNIPPLEILIEEVSRAKKIGNK